ncbi:MAG: hypothetical protein Q4A66_10470 [Eubacteriales bacterium]|nr:hypothetical protein [Eubacteriales bacterium]
MNRRALALLLMLTILMPCVCSALAVEYPYTYTAKNGMLFEKISHRDTPVEQPDGVVDYIGGGSVAPYVPGVSEQGKGDRGHSYSYASVSYGDWVYINTMYGGLSAHNLVRLGLGGLDADVTRAVINALWNGHMYMGEPDGVHGGGILFKFNVKTGETVILLSRDKNGIMPTFRDAIEFNGKFYFVGMVLDMNKGLTNAEIQSAINMQNGFPCIYEVDPANNDKITCVYDCVDVVGFKQLIADNVFTSTRAIGEYKNTLIAGCLDTDGVFLTASKNPSAGKESFSVIADMDDLFNYPAYKRSDSHGGGGIYQVIEYNDDLYVVLSTGSPSNKNPQTGTMQNYAIVKGECSGDPTVRSSWTWSVLAGAPADGAKYPFGLDAERLSAAACTLYVFDDYLYIGEYNDSAGVLQNFLFTKNFTGIATNLEQSLCLYRMDKNGRIEKVVGDPTTAFPTSLSGLGSGYTSDTLDGYGSHLNQYTWQITDMDGKLYISTCDLSTFLRPVVFMLNGAMFDMSEEEWRNQINYVQILVELLFNANTKSRMSEREIVLQAAENVSMRNSARTRVFSENITLTEEQIDELIELRASSKELSAQVLQKLDQLNNNLDLFYHTYIANMNGEIDPELLAALAADYAKLLAQLQAIMPYLPENVQTLYKVLLSIGTEQNLYGLLSSMEYFAESEPGFDLFELSHTQDGGVHIVPVTTDGFGDEFNHGLRIFEKTDDHLVIGTANPFYGTQLWRTVNPEEKPDEPIVPPVVPVDPEIPATGDSANLALWFAMLAFSLVGMLGLCRQRVKKSR